MGFLLPLLLNRYVIGALASALLIGSTVLWWGHKKDELRTEGAAACQETNRKAQAERDRKDEAFRDDQAKIQQGLRDELKTTKGELDRLRKERKSHVSATADAQCVIPRGFVRDHDRDLPRAAQGPELPLSAADADKPAGVVLSRVSRCVGSNYTECAKIQRERDTANEERYQACLAWDKRYGTQSGCTR